MNLSWLNFVSLAILIPLLFINFILPGIKLHSNLNKEIFLQENIQKILDDSRTHLGANIETCIQSINLSGVKIIKVEEENIFNFKKIKVYFKSFDTYEKEKLDLKNERYMTFIMDRNT